VYTYEEDMNASLKVGFVGIFLFCSLFIAIFVANAPADIAKVAQQRNGAVTLSVAGTRVVADVADTQQERIKGLSGRASLPYGHGMLFVFDDPGHYAIWMKDMRFPLDVYWIDAGGRIVDIWENARPESYPRIYTPAREALYILEVPAGFSEVFNISRGDRVTGLPRK